MAKNWNPSFLAVLTQFANYLHTKNLRTSLNEPNLRPKSLDAFLELQQTIQVMGGTIKDLELQLKIVKKKLLQAEEENQLFKRQWQIRDVTIIE